jgi:hypothetical protein
MSRRKNGVRKDWKKNLTKISVLKKKLKKNPENDALRSQIKTLISRTNMPKSKKHDKA